MQSWRRKRCIQCIQVGAVASVKTHTSQTSSFAGLEKLSENWHHAMRISIQVGVQTGAKKPACTIRKYQKNVGATIYLCVNKHPSRYDCWHQTALATSIAGYKQLFTKRKTVRKTGTMPLCVQSIQVCVAVLAWTCFIMKNIAGRKNENSSFVGETKGETDRETAR